MGSAPHIPSFRQPSGQPSFMQTPGIDPNQLISAMQAQNFNGVAPQGSNMSALWTLAGLDPSTGQSMQSPSTQAMMADLIGYNLSDQDLAARYPQLAGVKNQYLGYASNLLGKQTPQSMAQGNALMGAGQSAIGESGNIIGRGQGIADWAKGIANGGQDILRAGEGIIGSGQGLVNQAVASGAPDMQLGQSLINGQLPMDPLVQQELMRSGLSGAAGSLGGAAALGGTAGQAAVGRQFGLGAQNWIDRNRQMGMALQGQGMQNITGIGGFGTNVIGAGTGVGSLGNAVTGTGISGVNAGTGMTTAGTGLFNTGIGAVTGGAGVVNNAAQSANQTGSLSNMLFQPRTFGLSGTDAANVALANIAGQNNMNQYLYNTKVQAAQQNNQIMGLNANAAAQSQGNLISGGVGVASAAAAVGVAFALSCAVAQCVYGLMDPRFYRFRFWMINLSPRWFRSMYIKHSRSFAIFIWDKPIWKKSVRFFMDLILWGIPEIFPMHVPSL